VVEPRQNEPALAAHVGGRDHRAGDVAGEEEEEGDVADGEVHPGAQEVGGQRQLRGAAEHAPAGEHHERGDGGAGPALAEDRPQDVGRLHRDEHLHVGRSARILRVRRGPSGSAGYAECYQEIRPPRHVTSISGVHARSYLLKNLGSGSLGSVVAPRR
jgi:hypothetical protein